MTEAARGPSVGSGWTSRGLAVLAAAVAVTADRWPGPVTVAGLAATFLVTPGWLFTRAARSRQVPEGRWAAALALSPFLAGAPIAGLAALGVPLRGAALGVAALIGALALAGPRRAQAPAPADGRTRVAILASAAWVALIAALLIGNRYLPPRADGWFHAAVTQEIAHLGVPPEDPYFAGVRLLYFWGVHVWAAAWLAIAPRLAVWTPLIAFNLSAAAAVMLAVAALARRLGAGPRGVALAAVSATLGYSPFGWVWVVARAMVGDVTGWAEIARTLGRGAVPASEAVAWQQLHGSMAFFADKFLVLTQFSMALALFLLTVAAILDLEALPGPAPVVTYAVLLAAALFTHTLAGYALVVLALVLGAWLAAGALRGRAGAAGTLGRLALGTAAACAALSPYLLEITLGKHGEQVGLGLTTAGVFTLLAGGLFYVGPGLGWLAWKSRGSREARTLLLLAAVVLAMGLALQMPDRNQSKFFNLAWLLLAVPAALGWREVYLRRRRRGRTLIAAGIAMGVLPTLLVACFGFASERGQLPQSWHPPSRAELEAMDWASRHTPVDAAFCDLGGGRELLTTAGRGLVWGGFLGERDWGYPAAELAAHRDLAGSLCRGRDPGPAGRDLLSRLRREVIVVARSDLPDSLSDHGAIAARPERFELLWRNDVLTFWKVRTP